MCNQRAQELCQIYIPAETGVLPQRQFYQTRLNGRYDAQLVCVSYNDDTVNNDHRLIKVQSDCFRMPYGSFTNTIILSNKSDHTQGSPGGVFPIQLEIMGGGIDLDVSTSIPYNNTGNNTFKFLILTFAVSKLVEEL